MLYGLAEKPVITGWWTRAKTALGGVDARVINRYQLEHLILPFEPGKPEERPRLRLVNLVPGFGAVSAEVHQDMRTVSLAPAKYASASPKKAAGPGKARVVVSIPGARAPLAEFDLDLSSGSNHILAVTGLGDGAVAHVVHLVSAPNPKAAPG